MGGAKIVLGHTHVAPRRNRIEITYGGAVLEHCGRHVPDVVCFLDRDWTEVIQATWDTHRPTLQNGLLVLEPIR